VGPVLYLAERDLHKDDSQDRLIDLSNDGKVVTYASYRGADSSSPLKLRVRWRVVIRYEDRPDEVKYFKEDYRIPVPFGIEMTRAGCGLFYR